MEVRVREQEAFKAQAERFASTLAPRADGATVVALSGELGAGKTTFVQALARSFGVEDAVTSPTFVIEKVYELRSGAFRRLVHIDAYRLQSARELEVLGWKELAAEPGTLICIEWPERVEALIPREAIRVRFDFAGEERIISIDGKEKSARG